MHKTDLKTLTRSELIRFVENLGEKPFRASQLWLWLYHKGVTSFDEMSNLSKDFRERLKNAAEIRSIELFQKTVSVSTGTQKFLWRLQDGQKIESVFIPESDRKTICISSQAGCALGCTFCATGGMGFRRNLEACEIVDQVLAVRRETGVQPTNIVVMGMGEPFLNYENTMHALDLLNDPEGVAVGHRKITVSTAGIVPRIRQYTEEDRPYKLAVSLNAVSGTLRTELMPVNKTYPLGDVIQSVRDYTRRTGRRATFEYVLLNRVNDFTAHADRLLNLLKGLPCKVNLIVWNPTSDRFSRPDHKRVQAFAERIQPLHAPVILRLSRGDDIDAACGQLAGEAGGEKPVW